MKSFSNAVAHSNKYDPYKDVFRKFFTPGQCKKEEPEKTTEELLAELNELVGLEQVKEDVNSLINLVSIEFGGYNHPILIGDILVRI